MSGRIQSIERAAAVLRVLGASPGELSLASIADQLGLARPTLHGILATLVDAGFVQQDVTTRCYRIGTGLQSLQHGVDRHDLRSRSMSWCDSLASRVATDVLVCIPAGEAAEVVHHVLPPGARTHQRRLGELLPLHATGIGKVLLATAPATRRQSLELWSYTARTASTRPRLHQETEATRHRGYGIGNGELRPEEGDLAAPIREPGGLTVGVVGCVGPRDDLFHTAGAPRPQVLEPLLETAAMIGDALGDPR